MAKTAKGTGVSLPDDPEVLLDEEQAGALVGLSRWFIQARRRDGSLPAVKLSTNRYRYRRSDVLRFIEKRSS